MQLHLIKTSHNPTEMTISEHDLARLRDAIDQRRISANSVARNSWYTDEYRDESAQTAILMDELIKFLDN